MLRENSAKNDKTFLGLWAMKEQTILRQERFACVLQVTE